MNDDEGLSLHPDVAERQVHTVTGQLRARCLLCPWESGVYGPEAGVALDDEVGGHMKEKHGATATWLNP